MTRFLHTTIFTNGIKRFFKLSHLTFVCLACLFVQHVSAQGTFKNLNFEATTLPQNQPPGLVSASAALPFWAVFYGANQQGQVTYNNPALGSTFVCFVSSTGPGQYRSLEGGYSVVLQGGVTATDASITQTGLVPSTSHSIQFKAQQLGTGTFLVTLGGQNIPLLPLSTGANYTLYGGDVSAFAGQTTQLSFSALQQGAIGPNDWNLDSIVFSTQIVPEPSTFCLFAVAAMFLGRRFAHQRR